MRTEKIEPRLLDEIRSAEGAQQTDRRIPVIIALAGQAAEADPDRPLDHAALEERVRTGQQALRRRMSELGVSGEIRQITLSNALEALLTAAQIREMARHSDVRSIILNREEKVTA